MAWVAVHQQIDGSKLRKLRKRLHCSKAEAVGILTLLWLWGLDNADETGLIIDADKTDIRDVLIHIIANPSTVDSTVDAIVEDNWIDEVDGKLYFHDWQEWQGEWYKALRDRKRKADWIKNKRSEAAQSLQEDESRHRVDSSVDSRVDSSVDVDRSPSPSPSPSPKYNIKDYSLEIENFRHRYPDFLDLIDRYFDILRTTRVSGKISDSIIHQVYTEMDKHPVIVVKYACSTVVNKPDLHSKKENYFYGIMRNTTAEDAESKLEHEKPQKEGMTAWGTQIRK